MLAVAVIIFVGTGVETEVDVAAAVGDFPGWLIFVGVEVKDG